MKEADLRGQINPFATEERFWSQKDERVQLTLLHFLTVTAPELLPADRANPKLAERYDWLSPAILRFLRRVAQGVVGHPVELGGCGVATEPGQLDLQCGDGALLGDDGLLKKDGGLSEGVNVVDRRQIRHEP